MDMLNLGIAIVMAVTLNIIDNPPAKLYYGVIPLNAQVSETRTTRYGLI